MAIGKGQTGFRLQTAGFGDSGLKPPEVQSLKLEA
jgi:hypothetical protein